MKYIISYYWNGQEPPLEYIKIINNLNIPHWGISPERREAFKMPLFVARHFVKLMNKSDYIHDNIISNIKVELW